MSEERAIIQHLDRFKQPILFEGMSCGKAYPTDMDAGVDYHGWLFMFFEVKRMGKELEKNSGQFKFLTRLCDTVQQSGNIAMLLICRHDVENVTTPIYLKDTLVSTVYYNGDWHEREQPYHTALDWYEKGLSYGFIKETFHER